MTRYMRRIAAGVVAVMALSAAPGIAACWFCDRVPGEWTRICHIRTKTGPGKIFCLDRNFTCRLYRASCFVKGNGRDVMGPLKADVWY